MQSHIPDTIDNAIDLDAYCQRIGYDDDRTPTLKTLQSIHLCHTQSIAFENLTSLLQQPVLLDLDSLQQKLIHERRGGYCFEQNLLFRAVLVALGFRVANLAARVLWNIPPETIMPRTHMLLQVEIDNERYIADVGFGGVTLTAPLSLSLDVAQHTPHGWFRLLDGDPAYTLQAHLNQTWHSLYRFDLHEQLLPDYEVSNWYVSTHPDSLFVNALIAARPDVDRRYTLRNSQLTIHHLNGLTERQALTTVSALRAVLENQFRLQLPAAPHLDAVLQQFIDLNSP